MPVDRDELKAVIREAVGGDEELAAHLEQKMLANDKTATAFISGYMRNRDYTQKTQSLADDRRIFDNEKQTMQGTLDKYRQDLEAVETAKAAVLRELANKEETLSGAYARLQRIKQTYQLSDDDIPDYKDLIDTKQRGKPVDTSVDIETRLKEFKKEITSEVGKYVSDRLVPELGGLVSLQGIIPDVWRQHEELTGKRFTRKEHQELLNEADKRAKAGRPISYEDLWEEKYDVPSLRQKVHDTQLEKDLRAKWDAEYQAKISEQAMAGIRPTPGDQSGLRTSQIFDHKFKLHEDTAADAAKPREAASAVQREALGGAERATKRHLERRANGIPMGAPDERKAGGGKAA